MMKKKKNRTRRKKQVAIPFPVMLANILVVVAVFGIGYVFLCARCEQLGQDIKRLESTQRETRRRLINEQDRWASLLAPASFERALARHGLTMTLPDARRIVRVRRRDNEALTLAYNRTDRTERYE